MAYRRDVRAVFLYGFAKNERDNVADDELQTAGTSPRDGWKRALYNSPARWRTV
jgi:hypothetical protein